MAQRYVSTRVIYDLVDRDEDEYTDEVIACMPIFVWRLARTLIRSYGLRRVNYSVLYEQAGYTVPDDVEFDKIDASVSRFLGGDFVLCEDIIGELGRIANALEGMESVAEQKGACNTSCGGNAGSGGSGSTDPAEETFEDDGETTFPPTFTDRSAYELYKCKTANNIISQITRDCDFLAGASLVQLVASALALTLFTPIPFDDLLVLAGVATAWLIEGVLLTTALGVKAAMEDEEEELVCILFSAFDVGEAKSDFIDHLDGILSASELILAKYFAVNSSFNALFKNDALYSQSNSSGGIDCTTCPCEQFGTVNINVSSGPGFRQIDSEAGAISQFLQVSYNTLDQNSTRGGSGPFGPYCGDEEDFTITMILGDVTWYTTWDDDGNLVQDEVAWDGSEVTITERHVGIVRNENLAPFRILCRSIPFPPV